MYSDYRPISRKRECSLPSLTDVRLPNRREQSAQGIQGLRFFSKNGNLGIVGGAPVLWLKSSGEWEDVF